MRQENEREDQGKVYRTVVRPALMYEAETWALKKAQEKKLEVAEMRMLRWMLVYAFNVFSRNKFQQKLFQRGLFY